MADQIEINIHLKGGGQETASDGVGSGQEIPGLSQPANTQGSGSKTPTVDVGKIGKYISSQTIDVFLNNTKSIISQNIGLVTGKTELQQRVNFGLEVAQQGVNAYKNAQAGAIMFSAMGLSGGAGAVLGVALSAIGTIINYGFRQSQLNLQESLENKQISQIRSRAGAGFNRSREGK